eukprot:5257526-Prymnesium_polylepis.1
MEGQLDGVVGRPDADAVHQEQGCGGCPPGVCGQDQDQGQGDDGQRDGGLLRILKDQTDAQRRIHRKIRSQGHQGGHQQGDGRDPLPRIPVGRADRHQRCGRLRGVACHAVEHITGGGAPPTRWCAGSVRASAARHGSRSVFSEDRRVQ